MNSNGPENLINIKRNLKIAIKAKGFTYEMLAKKLHMTVAGIKRLLNAKDISLGRALEICRAIDSPLSEIIGLPEDHVEFQG